MASIDLSLLSAYMYDLPEELIAQEPPTVRGESRLMVVSRRDGAIQHKMFRDIAALVEPGDVLVTNDTRVLNARVMGHKVQSGAASEIFFLRPVSDGLWEAFVRPGKKLQPGAKVQTAAGDIVTIAGRTPGGARLVRVEGGATDDFFHRSGSVPLPHYIKKEARDPERYQTVYSDPSKTRSVAAPTAGLHFTPEILAAIEARGASRETVTLDVGAGTFRPVREERIEHHEMHTERCSIEPETARRISAARLAGGRAIAVGTTSVRTLETFASSDGELGSGTRDTDIFIRPGVEFKITDALVTNFHLPGSTLLMLVCAFAGYDLAMEAYLTAVRERYRFFSFGDAMFII